MSKRVMLSTTAAAIPPALLAEMAKHGIAIADADEGEKSEEKAEADSDDKLGKIADMIGDACAKMDAVGARMDAMEENFRRMDSRMDAAEQGDKNKHISDAEKKDEEKGVPEEAAADKSEDEKESGGEVKDRKDSEEKEEKEAKADSEDKDDKAEADSAPISRADFQAMQEEIRRLQARAPAIISDADRERFASIQEQADAAFQAFGDRAPAPMDGETPTNYKRRLASKMQKHSKRYKDVRLSGVSDDALLDTVCDDIYADSIAAARQGVAVPEGHLREVVHQRGGHTIIEFEGAASSWMNQFAGHTQRAVGDWRRPN